LRCIPPRPAGEALAVAFARLPGPRLGRPPPGLPAARRRRAPSGGG